MSLTLFTKTYQKDYPWLKLAMTSVIKMCQEDIFWTIVGDPGSKDDIQKVVSQAMQATNKNVAVRIIESQEHWNDASMIPNGYLGQQWIKMNAHRVMGDGFFHNWDSDVIAIKPFTQKSFFGNSGKPIYWFSQFNSIMDGVDRPAHEARIQMMKEILGLNEISFEWMRCMPVPMYGQVLKVASTRHEWGRSFNMMKNGDNRFSEFNVIGQFSHLFFPDAYEWRNAEASGPTWSGGYVPGGVGSGAFQDHAIISQCWSYGGIPAHIEEYVSKL